MKKMIQLPMILLLTSLFLGQAFAYGGEAKGTRKKLDDKTKKELLTAFEINEALHASFFKYDAFMVETNAKRLADAFAKVSNKEIAGFLSFPKTKLGQITAKTDRKVNNQNYHLVSMALIGILKRYDLGSTYNAYSCSMVQKQWVQNSTKMNRVHNPYAPYMPHCGSKDSNLQ